MSQILIHNSGPSEPMPRASVERADVLVVDDLTEKLLVYRTILEDLDVNLVMARSGQEALKEVLQREFAVILLDVNMPGMDGFETATLIRGRKRSARTPIIFITAFADDVRAAQGYASGAVDYIPTPVVPEVLRAKVQVFVELFQMRRLSATQAEDRAKRAAAEELAERSAFLAEAGTAMSRSIGIEPTFNAILTMAVPFLADAAVLQLSPREGYCGRIGTAWSDRTGSIEGTLRTTEGCPLPWVLDAMERTRVSDRFSLLDGSPVSTATLEEGWPDVEGGTTMLLPLSVRGQVHGTLALLRRHSAPAYRPEDVLLARELASRAGIALENAILVQDIQEADRRKDEFLGMLAHELRNPLGPMRYAVDILDLSEQMEPMLRQARDVIDRQVTHMARLVDDLLDATRIARGKVLLRKEECDLARIVAQTVEDYRPLFADNEIELRAEMPDAQVRVSGDPTRLAQMVGNLLHNAHKFTDRRGNVHVRLSMEADGRTAVVSVRDNGVGIEPSVLPHVFDLFRQADQGLDRSRGGLGLGLTLVKGLVEMHGGSVTAASAGPGQGSTFMLHLPVLVTATAPAPHPVTAPEHTANGHTYRILVIEDNRDAAESARTLLGMEGHEVMTAYTGTTGLEAVRRFHPQVILCDIGLPGMDGYEVARAVRQDRNGDPAYLIAITGYGREEDLARAHDAGFDLHLTKPIDHAKLRTALAGLHAHH